MEQILAGIGWNSNFKMPIANATNNELQLQIENKTSIAENYRTKIEDRRQRITSFQNYLKNVSQELKMKQELQEGKRKEMKVEVNLKALALRETAWLKQTILNFCLLHEKIEEKCVKHKKEIMKNDQKSRVFENDVHWDIQVVNTWTIKSSDIEKDCAAHEKSLTNNQQRFKDLQLKLEKATEECLEKKRIADKAALQSHLHQVELDKIAEDFRNSNDDRNDLLQQWDEAIKNLQSHDKAIEKHHREMLSLSRSNADARCDMKNKRNVLQEKKEVNSRLANEIKSSEVMLKVLLNDFEKLEADFIPESELEAQQAYTAAISKDLETNKSQAKHYNLEVQEKSARLVKLKKQVDDLRLSLDHLRNGSIDEEAKVRDLEQLLANELGVHKQMEKESSKVKKDCYDVQQKINVSKDKGLKTSSQKLVQNKKQLQKTLAHQRNSVCKLDLNIQKLDYRLKRLAGDTRDEKRQQLHRRVRDLECVLEEKKNSNKALQSILDSVVNEVQRAVRATENEAKEKINVERQHDEMQLQYNGLKRQSGVAIEEKQNVLVDESLMKLDIKRLINSLMRYGNDAVSQEQEAEHLNEEMNQKQQDISSYKNTLINEKKLLNLELKEIKSRHAESKKVLLNLKNRYDVMMKSVNPSSDLDEAQLLLMVNKEKAELRKQEEELTVRLRDSEVELLGMKNSLQLITLNNHSLQSLVKSDGISDDQQERKKNLIEQIEKASMENEALKKEILNTLGQQDHLAETDAALTLECDKLEVLLDEKQQQLQDVNTYIAGQKKKLSRAESMIKRARKVASCEKMKDTDIQIYYLKGIFKDVFMLLKQFMMDQSHEMESLNQLLIDAKLPSITQADDENKSERKTSSKFSSRPQSNRSQISSSAKCTSNRSQATPLSVVNVDFT